MVNYKDVKEKRLKFGISQEKLAELTGISRTAISNGEQRKSRLSAEYKELIEAAFDKIALEMEKENDKEEEINPELYKDEQNKIIKAVENKATDENPHPDGIPLIPVEAMAGFGTGEVEIIDYDLGKYKVPEFTVVSVDFMIRVKGSSMYPKYSSGDLVACKKINLKDIFFQWNKVYVMDTEQGALIKRVRQGKDKNHIRIVSDNEKYPPFDLHLSKIRAIAIVLGCIRLE